MGQRRVAACDFRLRLCKGQPGLDIPGFCASRVLPAANRDIRKGWVSFDDARCPTGPLGSQDC